MQTLPGTSMPARVASPRGKTIATPDLEGGDGLERLLSAMGRGLEWCVVSLVKGYRGGRFMPSEDVPTKNQVLFILAFCLTVVLTIDWWLPPILKLFY